VAAHLLKLSAAEVAALRDVDEATRLLLREPLMAWTANKEAAGHPSQASYVFQMTGSAW
jgi:hypothetical protein